MTAQAAHPFVVAAWNHFWQNQEKTIYPLAIDNYLAKLNSNPKILGDFTQVSAQEPIIVESLVDYGNIENWFTNHEQRAAVQQEESYLLDIEKLNIKNAIVKIGGNNIDHNLVQFNPDAKIGDFGAPVIFGHSVLRQFYYPKETNKDRYKSIFSMIMTLEKGDEIKITTGALTYTYVVTEKKRSAAG